MGFWQQPLDSGRIWRGPSTGNRLVDGLGRLLGMATIVATVAILTAFTCLLIAFEAMLFIHDPVVGATSFGLGATAMILLLRIDGGRRAGPHHPPDDPTSGAGVPIPRVPAPLSRVGAQAETLPDVEERFG